MSESLGAEWKPFTTACNFFPTCITRLRRIAAVRTTVHAPLHDSHEGGDVSGVLTWEPSCPLVFTTKRTAMSEMTQQGNLLHALVSPKYKHVEVNTDH